MPVIVAVVLTVAISTSLRVIMTADWKRVLDVLRGD